MMRHDPKRECKGNMVMRIDHHPAKVETLRPTRRTQPSLIPPRQSDTHLRVPSSGSSAPSSSSHSLSLSRDSSGGKDSEKVPQEQNCGKGMVPESAFKHSPQGSWSSNVELIVGYASSSKVREGASGRWHMSPSSSSQKPTCLPVLIGNSSPHLPLLSGRLS